jgi:hypothetical protein
MAITSPFPARPNPAYTRSALITVLQTPDAADDGTGDDEGSVDALAEAPGPAAESEAAGEAVGTSVRVAAAVLGDDAADGPNAVGAGPPHAATTRAIVARAPMNLTLAPRTTVRRDRIRGL